MINLCDISFSSLSVKARAIIDHWIMGEYSFEEQLAVEPNGSELQQELLQTGAFWLENGKLCVQCFDDGPSYELTQSERRRLFLATMRRAEMRMLRGALLYLKYECGIDWQKLTRLEINYLGPDYWMLTTDHHLVVCWEPKSHELSFYKYSLD